MKKLGFLLVIAFTVVFGVSSAQANSVTSQLFPNEENQLSDNSAEYLINQPYQGPTGGIVGWETDTAAIGGGAYGTDTIIDVGDRFRGHFTINTVEDLSGGGGTNFLGGTSGNNELTGFFDILVASKVPTGTPNQFNFGFVPYPGFALEIEAMVGYGGLPGTLYPGAAIAAFEDPANDHTRLGTLPNIDDVAAGLVGSRPYAPGDYAGAAPYSAAEEALIATATGGSLYWVFGYTGPAVPAGTLFSGHLDPLLAATSPVYTPGPGQGWVTLGAFDDIATVHAVPAGSNVGIVDFALNLIHQPSADPFGAQTGPDLLLTDSFFPIPFGTVDIVHLNASGNIVGTKNINTPFDVWDNFDATIEPVPEPASMLLLGSGLLGLAGIGRRRFRKKD